MRTEPSEDGAEQWTAPYPLPPPTFRLKKKKKISDSRGQWLTEDIEFMEVTRVRFFFFPPCPVVLYHMFTSTRCWQAQPSPPITGLLEAPCSPSALLGAQWQSLIAHHNLIMCAPETGTHSNYWNNLSLSTESLLIVPFHFSYHFLDEM